MTVMAQLLKKKKGFRDKSRKRNPKWPTDYERAVKLTRNQGHANANYDEV